MVGGVDVAWGLEGEIGICTERISVNGLSMIARLEVVGESTVNVEAG